jgi:hypothetical protein
VGAPLKAATQRVWYLRLLSRGGWLSTSNLQPASQAVIKKNVDESLLKYYYMGYAWCVHLWHLRNARERV